MTYLNNKLFKHFVTICEILSNIINKILNILDDKISKMLCKIDFISQ